MLRAMPDVYAYDTLVNDADADDFMLCLTLGSPRRCRH